MIRSLRVRLILTFTLIFGAIQLVLGVIGLTARETYIELYFDEQLMRRADSIVTQLIQAKSDYSSQQLTGFIDSGTSAIYFRDFYIQVTDSQGKLLGRSGDLGSYRLPIRTNELEKIRQGRRLFETLAGEAVEDVAGPARQLRMVTMFVRPDAREPVIIQVATSTQHVEESKSFLRRLFLVGIPAGLLAAAMASWFAADRAVRTIADVTHLATQTTPEKLGQRVDASTMDGEIGEMAKNINKMLDRLEAGFAAQQRFVHDASHEIKTPVSILLSEAQIMQIGTPEPAEVKKFVRSVQHEMQRLGRLIESLLMITRSDGRTLVTLSRIESVNDVVVECVSRCLPIAQKFKIGLTIQLPMPEEAPSGLAIRGDSELVDAMLSNLIRNAINYSPEGTTVLVKVTADADHVELAVSDDGPCIPDAEKEKIFERFVRGSTAGPRHGTGLGLAIARSVSELHGGRIRVEDGPDGKGCIFVIRLPLDLPPEMTQLG